MSFILKQLIITIIFEIPWLPSQDEVLSGNSSFGSALEFALAKVYVSEIKVKLSLKLILF